MLAFWCSKPEFLKAILLPLTLALLFSASFLTLQSSWFSSASSHQHEVAHIPVLALAIPKHDAHHKIQQASNSLPRRRLFNNALTARSAVQGAIEAATQAATHPHRRPTRYHVARHTHTRPRQNLSPWQQKLANHHNHLKSKAESNLNLGVKLHPVMDPYIDQLIAENKGRPLVLNVSQWRQLKDKERQLTGEIDHHHLILYPNFYNISNITAYVAETLKSTPPPTSDPPPSNDKDKHTNATFIQVKVKPRNKDVTLMLQYLERDPRNMSSPIPINNPDPKLLNDLVLIRNSSTHPLKELYAKENSYMDLIKLPPQNTSDPLTMKKLRVPIKNSPEWLRGRYSQCYPFAKLQCQSEPPSQTRILCDEGNKKEKIYPVAPVFFNLSVSPLKCAASNYKGENFVFIRIPKTGSKFVILHIKASLEAYAHGEPHMSPRGWCMSGPETIPWDPCTHVIDDQVTAFHNSNKPPFLPFLIYDFHADYTDLTKPFLRRGKKVHVITFIKDPVDRVISEYKHISGNKLWGWWDYAPISYEPKSRQGFLRFLNDPVNAKGMRNRQTKMLAGCGMKECHEVYPSEDDMLEKAKENLRNTLYFGVTNIMDRSIQALYRTFGYNVELLVDQSNLKKAVRERNDGMALFQVDPHIVEQVVATNELDVKLYLYALQLFQERFESSMD